MCTFNFCTPTTGKIAPLINTCFISNFYPYYNAFLVCCLAYVVTNHIGRARPLQSRNRLALLAQQDPYGVGTDLVPTKKHEAPG